MSPAEYLALERTSVEKHEYVDGEIFAMAGCTGRHDTIATNTLTALHAALAKSPCQPFSSDMRVAIPAKGSFTYSDGMVVCGPEYTDETQDTLSNPCAIFEVLSPSTEAYDRGKKFEAYRSLSSLKDYVLISQHDMLVEHYARQRDGRWTLEEVRPGQTLRLSAVAIEIPIGALYQRLTFA